METSTGNLDPNNFTLDDIDRAFWDAHDLHCAVPPKLSQELMTRVVENAVDANADHAGSNPNFKSILAWGITIGVLAERIRMVRSIDQGGNEWL